MKLTLAFLQKIELLEELSTVVNQMARTVNVVGESFLSPDELLDLPIKREIENNPIDDALHEVQQDPDVDVVEEIEEDPVDNIDPPIITLRDARCHIRAVSTFLSQNLTILKNKKLLQVADGIKSSLDRMVTSVHHRQATLNQWIDD